MIDSPRDPAASHGPGTPRWVKAVGIAAIIVVLLVVVVMVIGGGEHGPGRHAASAGAGGVAHGLPSNITLQPGETKRLTWRFGHTGTLEYFCHEPGPYEAGMRGRITVS